jgi:glucose-1-phosphate cytidylyltransferase
MREAPADPFTTMPRRVPTVKAVILAGGLGTRLREETEYKPKPMVEVGGRPILWHIMKTYAHHHVKDFVVCIGYRGQVIKDFFLNYEAYASDFSIELGGDHARALHGFSAEDWRVTVAETGAETMTGGRVKRVAEHIGEDETFCVTYGDGVADVDISAVLDFHRSHGRMATMTVAQSPSRFGIVEIDEAERVEHFREKPLGQDWVNAGFFVFNREFIDLIEGDSTVLEAEPLEQLARSGELMAHRHHGYWQPMDTYREVQLLNALWDSGDAPWKV